MGNLSGELDESSTDSESEVNDSELEYSDGCPVENTEFDFEAIISEDLFPEYLEVRILACFISNVIRDVLISTNES